MKDEYTDGKKMARNGLNTVIYKGTFISNHSLDISFLPRKMIRIVPVGNHLETRENVETDYQ